MKRVLFFLFLMGVGLVSLYAQKSALKFNDSFGHCVGAY